MSEANFRLGANGEPLLDKKLLATIEFMLGKTKNLLIVDPNPKIALRVAELVRQTFPEANPITVQEDWENQKIRELGKTAKRP
jgi:hypothetical protein